MKKLILAVVFIFSAAATMFADNDKPINFSELPAKSKTFLKTYFGATSALYVTKDFWDGYDVYLKDGISIEFNGSGDWEEIEGKAQALPDKVVDVLPAAAATYLKSNFEGVGIKEIQKKRKGYEVELVNGIEITFNNQGAVVDYDD